MIDIDDRKQHQCSLPIYKSKDDIVGLLSHNDTAVILSETGSGKTTQIPQYLYEAGLNKGLLIGITQPRRVAATSVAARVAYEMNSALGQLVGYNVRFDDCSCAKTKVCYLTDGMLQRESITDPLLRKYSIIILDEAHERTINTDTLFGIVKSAQNSRNKPENTSRLKIVIMSATIDVDMFSSFFDNAPVLFIEGRQHSIDLFYAPHNPADYLHSCLITVFQIHAERPSSEHILVFLTGQEEIESTVKSIKDISKALSPESFKIHPVPFFAALSPAQQNRVFENTPLGTRKVIVSTNIAETSITIPGVKFVIDCGKVKNKVFDSRIGVEILRVQNISQAQAWQRTGRAGREGPGVCYRLYTEDHFDRMQRNAVPEIVRCALSDVLLQLIAGGITDPYRFPFITRPKDQAIQASLNELSSLGAIQEFAGGFTLSELGKRMVLFPLPPRFSRCLIAAVEKNCSDEMISILAIMSIDSVMVPATPKNRERMEEVRKRYISPFGDIITSMNIFQAYKAVKGKIKWSVANFLNHRNLRIAHQIRVQMKKICRKAGFPITSCGSLPSQQEVLRQCLLTGFFMNTAELQPNSNYLTLAKRFPAKIHPSSVLFESKPPYVLYTQLLQTNGCYMQGLCVVKEGWIEDLAPDFFRKNKVML